MPYTDDCAPMWATVEQFMAANPSLGLTEEEAEEALVEATWMLSGLVGDRFHEEECRLDEYKSRPGLCKIELAHQPVDTVLSVHRVDDCSGEATEVEGWCQLSGGAIRICCAPSGFVYTGQQRLGYGPYDMIAAPCHCTDGIIRVQYRLKSNLPPGAARNTMKLALEFWKSGAGKACALPERITNVTRQGISWTILDPLDFLDKGLTGIGSIDQWISRVNGKGWAGLIDPLTRPTLLLSEMTGCTPDCSGV